MPEYKIIWKDFIITGIVIIGLIAGYFLLRTPEIQGSDETPVLKYNMCSEFQVIQEEISCSDAIDVALESYPSGNVTLIERTEVEIPNAPEPGVTLTNVWSVRLNLREPLDTVEGRINDITVSINRNTGNLLMTRFK